jgi:hypothetical protein
MYGKIKREIEYSGSQITKHEKRFIYGLCMVLQLEKYLYTRFFCQKTRTYITLHKIISETIVDRRTGVGPKERYFFSVDCYVNISKMV